MDDPLPQHLPRRSGNDDPSRVRRVVAYGALHHGRRSRHGEPPTSDLAPRVLQLNANDHKVVARVLDRVSGGGRCEQDLRQDEVRVRPRVDHRHAVLVASDEVGSGEHV